MSALTQYQALKLLRYDPQTGVLFWKIAVSKRIKAGDRAGCFNKSTGYIQIYINQKFYKAHRVIWLLFYGYFPEGPIDHINHVRHDNRIENIRVVSKIINSQNSPLRSDSTTGIAGVNWNKRSSKWHARIYVDKQHIHLGYHSHIFEAACARKSAEIKYGFHRNHGV